MMKKSLLIVVVAALMSGCTIPRAAFKSSLMSQDSPQYHLVDVTSALTVKDAEVIPETRLDGGLSHTGLAVGPTDARR
ncbi:Vi polysaccharide export protein VexA [Budvicia aquatica]|uniref:Vi polysaccharide export protein VexA n=1 Tax=Budvicia aquatica TaxID=82979 RepID=A0A484ZCL3_9GAMM|nr:Vi polysaccharide export protein VexA [Budvicia aquatica]